MIKISPARCAAFDILFRIETEKSFSSVLLPAFEENLSAKDRALCHALALGVLRKQIYLDRVINLFNEKKLDLAVRLALRVGLFQLLFLNKIPAHAAINESVNLVRRAKKTSAANLVNAILRRASRVRIELNYADEVERIAVETSHPRWLIEKWTSQFGRGETEKLARTNNDTPNLVFRLTGSSNENTTEILRKTGLEISESETVENAWKVSGASEILRLYAADGKIYFQDEASQMVAGAVGLKSGEKFLDVCAAPGSKTTFAAAGKSEISNLIVAGDLHEHRVRILKENCLRQGAASVRIVRYDAEKDLPFADESFDAVLLDAPCSGTGTIRHNPEIRYFLHAEDFDELARKQLKILENASKTLKLNGRIIYSTCSLEREENEAVVEKFLAENSFFRQREPKLPNEFITAEGYARTFPQRDDCDGFFIAELVKIRK